MAILKKMSGLSVAAINRGLLETVIKPGGIVEFLGEQVDGGGMLCGLSVQARILAACAKEFDAVSAESVPWYQEKKSILSELESAGRKLAEANREADGLRSAVGRLDGKVDFLSRNNERLTKENANLLRRENRRLGEDAYDLQCQLDGCDQVSILQADLQRAKSEIAMLRAKVDVAKGNDSELRQVVNAPQDKSDAAEAPKAEPKLVPGDPPKDGRLYVGLDLSTGEPYFFDMAVFNERLGFYPTPKAVLAGFASKRPSFVGRMDAFLKDATRPVDPELERAKEAGIRAEAELAKAVHGIAKELSAEFGCDVSVEVFKL